MLDDRIFFNFQNCITLHLRRFILLYFHNFVLLQYFIFTLEYFHILGTVNLIVIIISHFSNVTIYLYLNFKFIHTGFNIQWCPGIENIRSDWK